MTGVAVLKTDILISIVIPTYNYAELLPRALNSVLIQLSKDVEVIVVDDGSIDNTSTILKDFSQRYPESLITIYQENAGSSAARNRGINVSRGRYVLLLDADDELLPGALDSFLAEIRANPDSDMIVSGYLSVNQDGQERNRLQGPISGAPHERIFNYLLNKKITLSPSKVLLRKEMLQKRLFPEEFRGCEDLPVFSYMLVNAKTSVIQKPLVRLHRHADSLRNQRENEEDKVFDLVEVTFAGLPSSCQYMRERYLAQRYLSLFRAACLRGERAKARELYFRAFGVSKIQALNWSYIKKLIRLWM